MRKWKERRVLYPENLRTMCVNYGLYTRGSNEEYQNLFRMLEDEDGIGVHLTTEKIEEIAEDILAHSCNVDLGMGALMYLIGRECQTLFESDNG